MKLSPRDYQIEAVDSIYRFFYNNQGNPLVLMPTGTGKSVVIALFLESVFRQFFNQKILVLTHVKELIQQNYEKLINLWPSAPAGINSSGLGVRDYHHKIIFAGIASIYKNGPLFGHVDLVLIDEADLVSPNEETMYVALINSLKAINPNLKVIGFTATGWKLGYGRLQHIEGGLFTDVCFDITTIEAFNRLFAEGYLSPLIPKRTSTEISVDGVAMRGGEYVEKELQIAVDKEEITEAAIRETLEVGMDRKHWIAFSSGIEHTIHVAEMLCDFGIPAIAIHSKMTKYDRDKGLLDYKKGIYRCAVNNNVMTTGFDFPGIDLIMGIRPSGSSRLWVQMLGRGTRPVYAHGFDLSTTEGRLAAIENGPKQNCLVLDFAGNTKKLGPINDPVIPKKKGEKPGTAPVRICEVCNTYNHASVKFCINCGHEFPAQVKIKMTASTDELIRGDLPVMEIFSVDHITYSKHQKLERPDSLKVTYYCGLKMFNEFVCIQHEGAAKRKAYNWWAERTPAPMPQTVDEAIEQVNALLTPSHLRVWVNKKYPEIMARCYDGTAFGTKENDLKPAPSVQVLKNRYDQVPIPGSSIKPQGEFDDDIPF